MCDVLYYTIAVVPCSVSIRWEPAMLTRRRELATLGRSGPMFCLYSMGAGNAYTPARAGNTWTQWSHVLSLFDGSRQCLHAGESWQHLDAVVPCSVSIRFEHLIFWHYTITGLTQTLCINPAVIYNNNNCYKLLDFSADIGRKSRQCLHAGESWQHLDAG